MLASRAAATSGGRRLGDNAWSVDSAACETVLRAIDAYNRRDLDALLAEMHPEIELKPPLTALAGNVYRGHDGVAAWLADLDETFERTRIEPVESRTWAGSCWL